MSMRGRYIRKLRNRIWRESRRIVRLRRQALDAESDHRLLLHNSIDNLKLKRERDIMKLEDVCLSGEGVLDQLRTGVESALDGVEEIVGAAIRE